MLDWQTDEKITYNSQLQRPSGMADNDHYRLLHFELRNSHSAWFCLTIINFISKHFFIIILIVLFWIMLHPSGCSVLNAVLNRTAL